MPCYFFQSPPLDEGGNLGVLEHDFLQKWGGGE